MKLPLTLLVAFFMGSILLVSAQTIERPDPKSKEYLLSFAEKVDNNWIWFKKGSNISAKTFFQAYAPNLGLGEFDEMRLQRTWEAFGINYYSYKQFHKKIEVENAEYILHVNSEGYIEVARGYVASGLNLPSIPIMQMNEALEKSLDPQKKYAWKDASWEERIKKEMKSDTATYRPKGHLVYANLSPFSEKQSFERLEIAFKFENVTVIEPFDNQTYYVSAIDGKRLWEYSNIRNSDIDQRRKKSLKTANKSNTQSAYFIAQTAAFTPVYSRYGSSQTLTGKLEWQTPWMGDIQTGVSLTDEARNMTGIYWADPQSSWSPVQKSFMLSSYPFGPDWGTSDQLVTMPFWAAQKCYDFYQSTFSRSGMNGSNTPVVVRGDANMPFNATYGFDGTKNILTFGYTFVGPTSGVDVVGHEFSHGVVRHTSNLAPFWMSGAINEGFADIMGLCIENYATGSYNWTIGEDAWTGGLRSFSNPNITSNAAVVGDAYYINPVGCTPDNTNDGCGVHVNSTLFSRWFGMLVTSSVGFTNARTIAYNTMIGLPSNATFMDVRNLSAQIARNMAGTACSSMEDYVLLKWSAVGIGTGSCDACVFCRKAADTEPESPDQLMVSPNPAKDHISVALGERYANPGETKNYSLFGVSGNLISEQASSDNKVRFELTGVREKIVLVLVTIQTQSGKKTTLQKRVVVNQ